MGNNMVSPNGKCGNCGCVYDYHITARMPRQLDCGHSFCTGCIYKSTRAKSPSDKKSPRENAASSSSSSFSLLSDVPSKGRGKFFHVSTELEDRDAPSPPSPPIQPPKRFPSLPGGATASCPDCHTPIIPSFTGELGKLTDKFMVEHTSHTSVKTGGKKRKRDTESSERKSKKEKKKKRSRSRSCSFSIGDTQSTRKRDGEKSEKTSKKEKKRKHSCSSSLSSDDTQSTRSGSHFERKRKKKERKIEEREERKKKEKEEKKWSKKGDSEHDCSICLERCHVARVCISCNPDKSHPPLPICSDCILDRHKLCDIANYSLIQSGIRLASVAGQLRDAYEGGIEEVITVCGKLTRTVQNMKVPDNGELFKMIDSKEEQSIVDNYADGVEKLIGAIGQIKGAMEEIHSCHTCLQSLPVPTAVITTSVGSSSSVSSSSLQ